MYRAWLAIGTAGLLGGVAVVSLFAGFGSPPLLGVAAASAGGGLLAYRYGRERMLRSVYAGVKTDPTDGSTADGAADGDHPGAGNRTTQATDGGETTADTDDSTGYDDWTWAGRDPDDPFWSDDPEDWEDPWAWEATDPEEAAREGRHRRGTGGHRDARGTGSGRGRRESGRGGWWRRDRPVTGERLTVTEAYDALGLEPGADLEAVRRAYRERAKETHPDLGGEPAAFIGVREAYERLREHLGGEE